MEEIKKLSPEEERCVGLRRLNARFALSLRRRFSSLSHPKTSRQARIVATVQITLTAAVCIILATVVILYNNYTSGPILVELPPRPQNPRPAIIWGTKEYYITAEGSPMKCLHEGEFLECDVLKQYSKPPGGADAYVFYATSMQDLPVPRDPKTLWALIHEESPRNNIFLMHEKALNLFNFTATISRFSDIPFPLLYLEDMNRITDTKYFKSFSFKNEQLDKLAPVVYIQTDCDTSTDRDRYVLELMKYINVDSYGRCINNKKLPLTLPFQPQTTREYLKILNHPMMLELLSQYKFLIAIENGVCNDYMTEKLWRALWVGTVPVYLGAPNVRDYLPHPKAAILLEDYPTPALMAARLLELNEDEKLYNEHLRHKLMRKIEYQYLVDECELKTYQFSFYELARRLCCMVCIRLHEDSDRVNMANKKHYDCHEPITAMLLDEDPDNHWSIYARKSEAEVEMVYEKIYSARANNISETFDSFVHLDGGRY